MMIEGVNVGPNCDLSHRILDGHDFSGLDLRYSDLHGSSLQNADFTDSILYGVNFVSTCLNGANFSSSKLIDPAVPFTNKELSDYQQQGEDLVTWEQEHLRAQNLPEESPYYFQEDHGDPTPFGHYVDSLFTTGRLFRWPESRHFRTPEMTQRPYWFTWESVWDFFLTVPGSHEEEGFPFFEKPEWLRFERNWVRSFVLHNAAACFDVSEHDDGTKWPGADEILHYPYFNMPPQTRWAEIEMMNLDEMYSFSLTTPEDCDICSGRHEKQAH